VVLEPDRNETDWWAGAPSVAITKDGTFYLAARMRDAIAPRGRRGYEIRFMKSQDGISFEHVRSISKNDVARLHGFERPSLVIDPATGKYKLYGCGELGDEGWCIWKMDDATTIESIDASTAHVVLAPSKPDFEAGGAQEHHATVHVEYKDPFITMIDGRWHMFVIGFDRVERAYHFTSDDGELWSQEGKTPVLQNTGWHDFYTRPACVVPLDVGFLLVYEGSTIPWHDPGYNIATGLAYTIDLVNFVDLTPDVPAFTSTTPGKYHTWRYSHWTRYENALYVYFEAARPNGTNEIRVSIIPL